MGDVNLPAEFKLASWSSSPRRVLRSGCDHTYTVDQRLKRKSGIRTSMVNMLYMEAFKSLALVDNGKEGEIAEQIVLLFTDFDNGCCARSQGPLVCLGRKGSIGFLSSTYIGTGIPLLSIVLFIITKKSLLNYKPVPAQCPPSIHSGASPASGCIFRPGVFKRLCRSKASAIGFYIRILPFLPFYFNLKTWSYDGLSIASLC